MVELCSRIAVNATQHVLANCDFENNFFRVIIAPWEWLTGGYFAVIFWAVIVLGVYLRYRNTGLALFSGILPLSFIIVFVPPAFHLPIVGAIIGSIAVMLYQMIHARIRG